jgi:hypothetical protein
MSQETINLLIQMIKEQGNKIDKLENKVDELIAWKNRLIAGGVILSAIFGYVWDWFKNFFGRN